MINILCLIISYSTIRDVVSTDSSCLHVNSKCGWKTGDISSMSQTTKSSAHSDIIIYVGTNDSTTKFTTEKITENMSQIMDMAGENRSRVKLSSVVSALLAESKGLEMNAKVKEVSGFTTQYQAQHAYGGSIDQYFHPIPKKQASRHYQISISGGRGAVPRTQSSTPNVTGCLWKAIDNVPSAWL